MKRVLTQAAIASSLAAVVFVLVMQARFYTTAHHAPFPSWTEGLELILLTFAVVGTSELAYHQVRSKVSAAIWPVIVVGMLTSVLLAVVVGIGHFVYARFLNPQYASTMIAAAPIPPSINTAAQTEAFRLGLEIQMHPVYGALENAAMLVVCGALASVLVAVGMRLLPNARLTSRSS